MRVEFQFGDVVSPDIRIRAGRFDVPADLDFLAFHDIGIRS